MALAVVVLVGAAVRLYRFPDHPVGLNRDELTSTYEAQALLTTGHDRFGGVLTPYLWGNGQGQNAIQSFLEVPVVAAFGLTPLSVRLVGVVFAILTLPLLHVVVRRWHGERVALVATFVLAVAPWHVIASRWGLDCNLLPFFVLLGVGTLTLALDRGERRPAWVVVSLVPFAVAVYAYALCVVVLALLLVLVAVTYRREMARARRAWVAAYALAAVVALPMLLFVLKNQVLGGATLPGEDLLPFTLHPLTEVRTGLDPLANLRFVATGFDDGRAWNSPPGVRPLMVVALLLVPVGAVALWRHRVDGLRSPFLLWLGAASTLLVTVTLNDNRANALLVPVVVAAACGFADVVRRPAAARVRHVVTGALLVLLVVDALASWRAYFSPEQEERFAQAFDVGFGPAVRAASGLETGWPVLVTDVAIADAQVMFHLEVPADELPHDDGRTPTNPDFDRWVFDASRLPAVPYLVVARTTTPSVPDQPLPDDCDPDTPAWSEGGWVVLRCGVGS